MTGEIIQIEGRHVAFVQVIVSDHLLDIAVAERLNMEGECTGRFVTFAPSRVIRTNKRR